MNTLLITVMALSLASDNAPSIQVEVPGTLIIAGGGKLPDAIPEAFVKAAGGKKARIVVIPTASEGADKDDAERILPRTLEEVRTRIVDPIAHPRSGHRRR